MEDIGMRMMRTIALELATRPGRLTRSTEFLEDLQLDSLEVESLKMAIEEEFCIDVGEIAAARMVTIGDAIEHVEQALQARPPHWRSGIAGEHRA